MAAFKEQSTGPAVCRVGVLRGGRHSCQARSTMRLCSGVLCVCSPKAERDAGQGRAGSQGPTSPEGLAASKHVVRGRLFRPLSLSEVASRTVAVLGLGLPGWPIYLPLAYSGAEQCITG